MVILQKDFVIARRRRVQVWCLNREVGTGVKRLESGVERAFEQDATVRGLVLELVLISGVVAL
jgi:hypothetical protein